MLQQSSQRLGETDLILSQVFHISGSFFDSMDRDKIYINPFTPKFIIQILSTIQEESDWVM